MRAASSLTRPAASGPLAQHGGHVAAPQLRQLAAAGTRGVGRRDAAQHRVAVRKQRDEELARRRALDREQRPDHVVGVLGEQRPLAVGDGAEGVARVARQRARGLGGLLEGGCVVALGHGDPRAQRAGARHQRVLGAARGHQHRDGAVHLGGGRLGVAAPGQQPRPGQAGGCERRGGLRPGSSSGWRASAPGAPRPARSGRVRARCAPGCAAPRPRSGAPRRARGPAPRPPARRPAPLPRSPWRPSAPARGSRPR